VRDEIGYRLAGRGKSADIMRLVAINKFNHMISLSFNRRKDRSISNRRIWAEEDKVVGKSSSCYTKV